MYGPRRIACAASFCLAVLAFGGSVQGQRLASPFGETSIGWARMDRHRTIILELSTGRVRGELGYGDIEIEPKNPHYRELLDHLGGLRPGETKPVLPWRADEKWHCAIDSRRGDCPLSHRLEPTRARPGA